MLTKTAVELHDHVFLDLFRLVDHAQPEVVVLKLLRIVQLQAVDLAAVVELYVEVGLVVDLDDLFRDTVPSCRLCGIAVDEHIPGGRTKLWARLPRDDRVRPWELDQSKEELRTTTRGLAVTPPTTEASVLGG
jgi:hypothetical protein